MMSIMIPHHDNDHNQHDRDIMKFTYGELNYLYEFNENDLMMNS